MFYAVPYRILFDDTMAYGTHHFLTNFKFQCEAREHLLFAQILDRCTAEERRTFDDIVFLTQDAFSRNLSGLPVGAKVGVLLSLEDAATSSVRFCFRVVGPQGQPVACGFQTLATVSLRTRQLVPAPTLLRQYGHLLRERLCAPNFEKRVLAGDMSAIFSEHVVQTGMRVAQASEDQPAARLVASVKWEADHASVWRDGLNGKAFLFPGTGSVAWSRAAGIVDTGSFRALLQRAEDVARSHLGYGLLRLAAITSDDGFKEVCRECPGIDQIANYAVSVHCAELLAAQGETADVVIGHSAGELSALAAGGAYGFEQGLDVICKRIAALKPHRGGGGMLVMSTDRQRVESVIAALGPSSLQISVVNHPDQVAVSGRTEDLTRLRDLATHLRIGHVLLPSEYPFHSKLLEPAVERFARLLGDAASGPPTIPVYSPLETDFYGAGKLADILPFHFARPLDYQDAIGRAYELGLRTFVDCSTGATLKGIVDRILAGKKDVVVTSGFAPDLLGTPRRSSAPVAPKPIQVAEAKPSSIGEPDGGDEIPIAIVGLGCVLPNADSPDRLWDNVKNGVGGIVDLADVTPLDATDFLVPGKIVPDKTYSLLSGVVGGTSYGAEDAGADGPSLAEQILKSAVNQAAAHFARSQDARVQLLIGSTADGYSDLDEALLAAGVEQTVSEVADDQGPNRALSEAVRRIFLRRPESAPSAVAHSVLNCVAREIFGPRASAIAIDAACASSLYAIELGIERLREDKADVAVCGGVFVPGPANGCLFSQFGGLSATGSRPFDASADGVVFCPGAAAVALKRLPDALRDGDRIEAVIRGCGTSSDGKGASVTEPKREGQVLAIRRAYAAARLAPETVHYVEAHATATRVGDAVEFAALNQAFQQHRDKVAIGSIKALIGHTGWTAGAASVIKVCRALQHQTIPPQANFSTPSPDIDLAGSRLVIPTSPLPWPRQKTPRRAGVNGFGFGGTNSHLIIEEFDPLYHAKWKEIVGPNADSPGEEVVVVGVGIVRPDDGALTFDDAKLKLPQRRRVLPDVMESMDRSQVLAIMAVDQALSCLGSRWTEWRDDIGVIFGFEGKTANSLQAVERIHLDRIKRRLSQAMADLTDAPGDRQQAISRLLEAVRKRTRQSGPYTLPGLMPNLICGRVANLFDLHGPNFVVDAAGASLIEALRIGAAKVRRGESKMILAGGLSANASPVSRLMIAEQWHHGRKIGEAAVVLALARADFAREASLQPLATLAVHTDTPARMQEINVGRGPVYLMGAEGADEIEAALSKARNNTASQVGWRLPNGETWGVRFSPAGPSATAIAQPPAPAIDQKDSSPAKDSVDAVPIEYCSIAFEPVAAPSPVHGVDLRQQKVLVLCDQPQALGIARGPDWICLSPPGFRIPRVRAVDPSSEGELAKSFNGSSLDDVDALLVIKDLSPVPVDTTVAAERMYTSLDLAVALARLLYGQIKQGRTHLMALCCNAWGERALHPATGLFGGMIKALARELPGSKCKAIYTDEAVGAAALQQLQGEFQWNDPDEPREAAYRNGMRHVARLVRTPRPAVEGDDLELDENSVVLATGGGRGVTAKLVEAILERRRCRVAIFGRLDPDDLPAALRGADDQALDAHERVFYQTSLRDNPGVGIKTLKQRFDQVRACAELHDNLDRFRSLGAEVHYVQADMTNSDAVDAAVASVKKKFGRLDLVIHGAGIQDSRTLDMKTLAEFRRVVSTKVDGLVHLHRACRRQFPASRIRYHLVTSTFSVLGNDGQPDYGAANEMLNRTAQWHGSNDEPWSALAWLGWAGVGMTRGPEYKQLATRRGLRPVRAEEGKKLFADFLASKTLKPVAILMSPGESRFYRVPIADAVHGAKPRLSGGAQRPPRDEKWKISLRTHRCLTDHRVGGRPTVPGALAIDLAVRSAQTQQSDFRSVAVKDVSFERFIGVKEDKDTEIKINTTLIGEDSEECAYRVELRSDFVHSTGVILNPNVLHYACNVSLGKLRQNIDAQRRRFEQCPRFITVPDPYLDSQSPVSLRGPFRCMGDIRLADQMRSASFFLDVDLPPEFSQSSIPCILLDALCRLSMLSVDAGGRLPICVPLRCARILVAAGANDHSVVGRRIELRAAAPCDNGEMMFNSYAEASLPDGHVLLLVHDLTAKKMGAVSM